eukprot:scaffold6888_cov84-Skeletonema_marinoi.AAC.2
MAIRLMAIGLMQCLLAVSMIVTEASMQEQVESGEASKQKCEVKERTKSKAIRRHEHTKEVWEYNGQRPAKSFSLCALKL